MYRYGFKDIFSFEYKVAIACMKICIKFCVYVVPIFSIITLILEIINDIQP